MAESQNLEPTLDKIVEKRILIDGFGLGDDKAFGYIIGEFQKMSEMDKSNPELKQTYQMIMLTIEKIKFRATRDLMAIEATESAIEVYRDQKEKMQEQIRVVKHEITELRTETLKQKDKKISDEQCQLLENLIKKQPDRKTNLARLGKLTKETSALEDKNKFLKTKCADQERAAQVIPQTIQIMLNYMEPTEKPPVKVQDDKAKYDDVSDNELEVLSAESINLDN